MSALIGHMKAMRALAQGYARAAERCGDEANALLLARISQAHVVAAEILEEQARQETGWAPLKASETLRHE